MKSMHYTEVSGGADIYWRNSDVYGLGSERSTSVRKGHPRKEAFGRQRSIRLATCAGQTAVQGRSPASLLRTLVPSTSSQSQTTLQPPPNPSVNPSHSPLRKDHAMINLTNLTNAVKSAPAVKGARVPFDQIDISTNHRPTHADKVGELVKSIRMLGLQAAPVVIERGGRYKLVSGRHRLEAIRVLGYEEVPVRIVGFDDLQARMWTISENLHRNELSALDRAEQIAEFVRLSQEKEDADKATSLPAARSTPADPEGAQLAHPERRYEQRGDSRAARDLGLSRDEVRRSRAIAELPPEVKAKAADLGLKDNQRALLEAAKAPTPQAQVETLERRAERAPILFASRPQSLRNLENIAAGSLARWVKETTPNDRTHVIRVLRDSADILEGEMLASKVA
jgi:ParB family transcriptional regulator, chromosome partitioning protein